MLRWIAAGVGGLLLLLARAYLIQDNLFWAERTIAEGLDRLIEQLLIDLIAGLGIAVHIIQMAGADQRSQFVVQVVELRRVHQ